jgi:hypothetical protein
MPEMERVPMRTAQAPWLAQPDDYYERLHVERGHPHFRRVLMRNYRAFANQYHPDTLGPDVAAEVKREYEIDGSKVRILRFRMPTIPCSVKVLL